MSWDADRVFDTLAGQLAELVQTPPDTTHGRLIGVGDWRFSVEILLPSEPTLWGAAVWADAANPDPDDSVWDTMRWADITDHVRGMEWTRGADEPLGRPRVGTATVTLDSTDDRFSPWNPNGFGAVGAGYFAPGTLVRCGLRSPTDTRGGGWLPQWTMNVEAWPQSYVGRGADRFVDLQLVETLADLARIDDNALPGVVGGGEGLWQRIGRLLRAADWQYGFISTNQSIIDLGPGTWPMQSTDMAQNRVVECYLTADSGDAEFYTDRTGAALVASRWYESRGGLGQRLEDFSTNSIGVPQVYFHRNTDGPSGTQQIITYDADSFVSTNADDGIRNDIRLARSGGTLQIAERPASIGRHGRRTWSRTDLITTSDGVVAAIAGNILDRRSRTTLTVDNMTFRVLKGDADRALTLAAMDIGNQCVVQPPPPSDDPRPSIVGYLRSFTHRVTPVPGTVVWDVDVAVDTLIVFNLPGAFIP